ncbi:MAG: YihY/virulence factor BrkB family protein [Mycoplasmatales bacterium]|nr:YihY/virulence factor BrkB family protein [Mycoplasmatales bacterium]
MRKKPSTGYNKKPKKQKEKKKSNYLSSLFINKKNTKISIAEKVVKFLIYISLRLAIRPKKWKNPEKNYEIIDRTYKRIMSADFVFIPSSIAFYLIMAFMPIMMIVLVIYQVPVIYEWLTTGHNQIIDGKNVYVVEKDSLKIILSKFIPGISTLIDQATEVIHSGGEQKINAGALTATILSLLVSSWIAAGGFAKLVFTQSYIYEHKYLGGYWSNKTKGISIVFAFSAFLFIALVVNILVQKEIEVSGMSEAWQEVILRLFLIVGLLIGTFSGFLLLYKFSPRFKIKFREIIPGTMVSTIPTAGFLIFFGFISSLWSYGNYGFLGTVMYIGTSSLIITYFVFVGIIANASYYKTFIGRKVKTKWTLSKK